MFKFTLNVNFNLHVKLYFFIIFQVPEYVGQGDHKLTVEGLADERIGQPLFSNTTVVEFVSKSAALFIMTDKYLYYPEQTGNCEILRNALNYIVWLMDICIDDLVILNIAK